MVFNPLKRAGTAVPPVHGGPQSRLQQSRASEEWEGGHALDQPALCSVSPWPPGPYDPAQPKVRWKSAANPAWGPRPEGAPVPVSEL